VTGSHVEALSERDRRRSERQPVWNHLTALAVLMQAECSRIIMRRPAFSRNWSRGARSIRGVF